MDETWVFDDDDVDWDELYRLYRIAPLGEMPPSDLMTVFSNCRFKCFVYSDGDLIGVGRALADGLDCSYIAGVAVHPDHRGRGLGTAIMEKLIELSQGHRKIILYANPGAERFYSTLGFYRMNTAMAIWRNHDQAISDGLISDTE